MQAFADPRDTTREMAEMLRPARRMKPSQAAVEYGLRDKDGRDWNADVAPYMVEPLDELAGREYRSIVFVGPARTSKTFTLIHGGINYIVTCDPGDTTIVQMTTDTARKFSHEEIGPVIRNSRGLAERLSPRAQDNNTFDKRFRSGMTLSLGWPAVSQLSGMTRKYMFVTDYDRPENRDNVDGEGPLYDLAVKRIETYMSRGKCLVESSPGEDYTNPSWTPSTPHEAPPALGIAALYNRGTRGRLYWRCLGCGHRFQCRPGPEIFRLPEFKQLLELVQHHDVHDLAQHFARVPCPQCQREHTMDERRLLNLGGRWLHDGEQFDKHDAIVGERRVTDIVSFWLGGAGAAFQRWDKMLQGYLEAIRGFGNTGDEHPIRTKVNTDFGASYMPQAAANRRKAEDLIQRAEDYALRVVPLGVCYLTAQVDVQGNRFEVLVQGWGQQQECWLIDRFHISQSTRTEADRPLMLEPAAYDEDWKLLVSKVLDLSYPLVEDTEMRMPVYVAGCDSGGKEGVTQRAYDFWRYLQKAGRGHHLKLTKGANSVDAKRLEVRYPDATNKNDPNSNARGDVPVLFINTTIFKDSLVGDLGVERPGPNYVHLPKALDPRYFAEYVAETRGAKGWVQRSGVRNEQFDLHAMGRALVAEIGAERIDWTRPPEWAVRPQRTGADTPRAKKPTLSLADLAAQMRDN